MSDMKQDLLVRQNEFSDIRWRESAVAAPDPGQVLLRVDQFALTANNITYAAYGDALGYWQFYPQEKGWGLIPVWGFAEVIDSRCDGVKTGERLFGYWPMSSHALLSPCQLDNSIIVEGAESRQTLNPFYNRYMRCASDPAYDAADEGWQSIFRPLGLTAFLIDEHVAQEKRWGASVVILSSASSKTSIGTAHFLSRRGDCRVIGLTAAGNCEFAKSFDCYDSVISYDDLAAIPADQNAVFIDMAGNAEVVSAVHEQLGASLRQSITVGGTHWARINPSLELPGPSPVFFFAPDHIVQRMSEWGAESFQTRFSMAWKSLMPRVQSGIRLIQGEGKEAVESVLSDFVHGKLDASKGHILRI